MYRFDRFRLRAWRWTRWARRVLAAGLLLTAAAVSASEQGDPGAAGAGPGQTTASVFVASRDLSPGHALEPADLATALWPAILVPAGTLTPADETDGRVLATGVRAGEVLTDVRLVGPGLVDSLEPGTSAVPVRLTDAGVGALLRPGDRIDLYAVSGDPVAPTTNRTTDSRLIAANALVLAVPAEQESVVPDGGIIVVGVSDTDTPGLVEAAYTQSIAATLRPP